MYSLTGCLAKLRGQAYLLLPRRVFMFGFVLAFSSRNPFPVIQPNDEDSGSYPSSEPPSTTRVWPTT